MKRTLILMAALVGLATAANAATISVAADKTTYAIGETITLTVQGISDKAEFAAGIFARVDFSGAGGVADDPSTVGTQQIHTFMNGMMTFGPNPTTLPTPTSSSATMLNQIFGLSPQSVDQGPPGTIGTQKLIATIAGLVNVEFFSGPPGTDQRLSYFSITAAPGTSFTIIPEPTTAALLGLGLLGLVLGGRRRS